jgi:hypothetical protein
MQQYCMIDHNRYQLLASIYSNVAVQGLYVAVYTVVLLLVALRVALHTANLLPRVSTLRAWTAWRVLLKRSLTPWESKVKQIIPYCSAPILILSLQSPIMSATGQRTRENQRRTISPLHQIRPISDRWG